MQTNLGDERSFLHDAQRSAVASNAMPKPYLYTYAVDREQYLQTHARKRTQTQINARKLIVAIDAWAISACKRDCILRVRSKTFRMYYMCKSINTLCTVINHATSSPNAELKCVCACYKRYAGFLSGGGGGEHLPPLGSLSPPLGTGRFAC